MFKKEYEYQGMVQFDENYEPCICGISVRWLDYVSVKEYSEKKAIEKACNILNKRYPEYKGMVQLW